MRYALVGAADTLPLSARVARAADSRGSGNGAAAGNSDGDSDGDSVGDSDGNSVGDSDGDFRGALRVGFVSSDFFGEGVVFKASVALFANVRRMRASARTLASTRSS